MMLSGNASGGGGYGEITAPLEDRLIWRYSVPFCDNRLTPGSPVQFWDLQRVSDKVYLKIMTDRKYSRGVYLQTGGGLDGHTPRAVGMEFLNRLRRLDRIKYSRKSTTYESQADPGGFGGHFTLDIPNVGYAKMKLGPPEVKNRNQNMKKKSKSRSAPTGGLGEINKHKDAFHGVSDEGAIVAPLPEIVNPNQVIGGKPIPGLHMEEILRALDARTSNIERHKRHSLTREQLINDTSHNTKLPPAATQVALKNARRYRHPGRPCANLPMHPLAGSRGQEERCGDALGEHTTIMTGDSIKPQKRTPMELAIKHQSVSYNHGIHYKLIRQNSRAEARARLHSLLAGQRHGDLDEDHTSETNTNRIHQLSSRMRYKMNSEQHSSVGREYDYDNSILPLWNLKPNSSGVVKSGDNNVADNWWESHRLEDPAGRYQPPVNTPESSGGVDVITCGDDGTAGLVRRVTVILPTGSVSVDDEV